MSACPRTSAHLIFMTPESPKIIRTPILKAKDLMAAVGRYLASAEEPQVWQKEFGSIFQNLPALREDEVRICRLEFTGAGDWDSQETHYYPAVIDFSRQNGRLRTKFVARPDYWQEEEKPIRMEIVDYSYGQAKDLIIEKKKRRSKRESFRPPEVRPGYTHPLTGDYHPEAQVVVTETWTADSDWRRKKKTGHEREVMVLKDWLSESPEPREWLCLEKSQFEPSSAKRRWPVWSERERVFPLEGDLVCYYKNESGQMILVTDKERRTKDKKRKLPQNLGEAKEARY